MHLMKYCHTSLLLLGRAAKSRHVGELGVILHHNEPFSLCNNELRPNLANSNHDWRTLAEFYLLGIIESQASFAVPTGSSP